MSSPRLQALLKNVRANIYLFKVNNRNYTKNSDVCSKLIIKTQEPRPGRCCGVFIVNFEQLL